MSEKIKLHFNKKKFYYLLPMLVVAISIGIYSALFYGISVDASVSSVTLVDNDITGYGLDGRDFTIGWETGSEPVGYVETHLFVLPSNVTLSTSTISEACVGELGSSASIPLARFSDFQMNDITLPEMIKKDSCGSDWAVENSYIAWVFVSSTDPNNAFIASSTAVSYANAFDAVADINAPFLDHVPVHTATESVDALIKFVFFDDQTTSEDVVDSKGGGSGYVKLYYGSDVSVNYSEIQAISTISGDLIGIPIPALDVPAAGGSVEYFLVANDDSNNTGYFCADPSASSLEDCKNNPFVINTVAAGSRTISGMVTSGGVGVSGVRVFAGGFAGDVVVTPMDGTYTISGLPDNNAYDVVVYSETHCHSSRFESVGTTNLTDIDLSINYGVCGFMDGGAPFVVFSGPPEGMSGVPLGEPIRVGFSSPLNSAAVNDSDPTDAGSNVYLTSDGGGTKIAGKVLYCSDSTARGCSGYLMQDDMNVIVFDPTSDLSADTFYTLVITEAVVGESGLSVRGNRSSGGHEIGFLTSGSTWDGQDYGTTGASLPPYIRSVIPAPGIIASPNTKIVVEFNEAMSSNTITTGNFTLYNITDNSSVSLASATLDSTEKNM